VSTVLVVDDDPNLLRMLRRGFSFAGYEVEAAADGKAALEAIKQARPDVLVLDVMLPAPLTGLEVAKQIRADGSDLPIIMLTARDQLVDKVAGFASGADDYLPKPFDFEELLLRVQSLIRRSHRPGDEVGERLGYADLEVDLATREVRRGGKAIHLTAREFDLLVHFLKHPRQVLTRDQIFRGVWGSDYLGSSNIIDANVSYLRDKLEQDGAPRLIQTVRGVGYALRES
jgi:two-component system response regulator MprA